MTHMHIVDQLTGSTPASSKKSWTVLLNKEEDALDTWVLTITDLLLRLTHCMTDSGEYHNILSSSQEDPKRAKGTVRQLPTTMNVLSLLNVNVPQRKILSLPFLEVVRLTEV